MTTRVRVLFVCLGNICRSPVAEGIMRDLLRRKGLEHLVEVSSAGLGGWHAGELPDHRARAVAVRKGLVLESRARKVDPDEFARTDWIVCMDEQNRRGLERIGAPLDRVRLLKSFAPAPVGASPEVEDPYEHGDDAFERMFLEIAESMSHLIDHLRRHHGLASNGLERAKGSGAAAVNGPCGSAREPRHGT